MRQCLVALSDSPKIRDLFQYRFDGGTFGGHSFGNVLLSTLEKITGDFNQAVETASEILRIRGTVIPATLDNVRLKMAWPNMSLVLHGERVIDAEYFSHDPRRAELSLTPSATANPMALAAIEQADIIVIAPGDLYTSLGPLLVIDGIGEALMNTKALKVYVSNLVSKKGQTDNFTVGDHAKIGAGSVVLKPVPAYATVVGIPGRIVVMNGKRVHDLQLKDARISVDAEIREIEEENDVDLCHDKLPDPEEEMIQCMLRNMQRLEKKVNELEKQLEDKHAESL